MAPEIIQEVGHDYKVRSLQTNIIASMILIDSGCLGRYLELGYYNY